MVLGERGITPVDATNPAALIIGADNPLFANSSSDGVGGGPLSRTLVEQLVHVG